MRFIVLLIAALISVVSSQWGGYYGGYGGYYGGYGGYGGYGYGAQQAYDVQNAANVGAQVGEAVLATEELTQGFGRK